MAELLPLVEQGPDPSLLRATWSSLLLRKALQHDAGQTQGPQLWDWVGPMGVARSREILLLTGLEPQEKLSGALCAKGFACLTLKEGPRRR